jgi:hypothetical protein
MSGNDKQQFIYKPLEVIQDERLSFAEQDYLCLIAQLEKAGSCFASNNYFANYFRVRRQSAQEIIGKLKSKGIISCSEQKQGGETVKRFIKIIDNRSRKALLCSRQNLSEDSRESLPDVAGDSCEGSRQNPTHITEGTIENKIELTAACADFLKCFPKKTKQREAGRIFKSLKLPSTELEKLMAAVKVLASQAADGKFAGDKGPLQYCPNPATWLEEKQWNNKQEQNSTQLNTLTHPATKAEIEELRAAGLLGDNKPQEQTKKCFVCQNDIVVFCFSDKGLCEECKQAYDLIPEKPLAHKNIQTPKQYLSAYRLEGLIQDRKREASKRIPITAD